MANYLIIETSGSHSFVLLCYQKKRHIAALDSKNQASQITVKLDTLLTQAGTKLAALDFIGIGKGPGSFTGSRVGVLVAKTLNYALSTPLVSFCSLLNLFPKKAVKDCILIGDAKSRGFSTLSMNDGAESFALMNTDELERMGQTRPLFFDAGIDLAKKGFNQKKCPQIFYAESNYDFICDYCEKAFANKQLETHDTVHVQYAFTP